MATVQSKIDNMVQVLEKYNYRVRMAIYGNPNNLMGNLIFDSKDKVKDSFFSIGFSETSIKTCNFKMIVNIVTDDIITLRNCENIINKWNEVILMCKELNSLNIPYLSNDINDELEYKTYLENAYKKIGKRFVSKRR